MKTKLTIAICLLSVTGALAQATASATVKGSPYLDETYVEAVILFANNTRTVPVRYNAYKDLMEYQQNGQPLVLDPTPTIKEVRLGDDKYVVEKYNVGGTVKSGYFELLDSGKVSLYAKKGIRYVPGRKGAALDGSDQPSEFKRTPDTFFIKVGTGTLTEIENIKGLVAALPDKRDEASQFAKKEKISPRDEAELRELIRYYNQL